MNRRRFANLVLLIAMALFAVPLVSPVPIQEPKLAVDASDNPSKHPYNFTNETVKTVYYDSLSPAAQQWFDTAPSMETIQPENIVPLDSPPEPWVTFAPDTATSVDKAFTYVRVVKNDRYYMVTLTRIIPKPPQQAVMLRLGPLVGSIVLFGLAGHLFLTAEN
jgi:hypothetical protein